MMPCKSAYLQGKTYFPDCLASLNISDERFRQMPELNLILQKLQEEWRLKSFSRPKICNACSEIQLPKTDRVCGTVSVYSGLHKGGF